MKSVDQVAFHDADDRLAYAEQEATAADLSGSQVAAMQAFLLGLTLTHFDESPVLPMTDARWRRGVRSAVEHARDAS